MSDAPKNLPQQYAGRCLTCVHWEGNKRKQRERECCHLSMRNRWPEHGSCDEFTDAVSIEVETMAYGGGGCVVVEIDACFGCVLWTGEGPLMMIGGDDG